MKHEIIVTPQHCPECQWVQAPASKCGGCGHVFAPETIPELAMITAGGFDTFDKEMETWLSGHGWKPRKNLLSGKIEITKPGGVQVMDDPTLSEIRFKFCNSNGTPANKDAARDAIDLIATRNAYHPVRDYLSGLSWDGVERLDTWLIDYAGAQDTSLNRAIGRKFLCAAVKRAFEPGCKFDAMLLLEGKQGAGKSSLCAALCRDAEWFSDQAKVGAEAKEVIEQTAGSWIIEMPELDGLTRRDAGRVKSFITTTKDKARGAYASYTAEVPRQFVLIGTTNDAAFLTDMTGNRRWWIVSTGKCDPVGVKAIRNQLWAEAVAAEASENIWLDDPELQKAQEDVAGRHMDYGPWFEKLAEIIPNEGDLKVSVSELWDCVGISQLDVNRLSVPMRTNMQRAMVGLGFDRETKTLRKAGTTQRCYVRGDAATAMWWSRHP